MGKRRTHQSVRQRQKMSFAMIAYVSVFCIALVTTCLVITINMMHVEKSMAQTVATYIIEDENFVTDKALPTVVVKQHPLFSSETKFMRKAKPIPIEQTNIKE
jgi:hypothetical protein